MVEDFMTRVGLAGVVVNTKKFQFCKKTVEFAWFRISSANIEPLPRYIDAIFPHPAKQHWREKLVWFDKPSGNYAQLRTVLAPFRPFLSPKTKFQWSDELDRCFKESKTFIINALRNRVQIFDLDKITCLRPGCSRKGIGYFLSQKQLQWKASRLLYIWMENYVGKV